MCLSQRHIDRGTAKLFIRADTKVLICGIWAQRRIPCRLCTQRGPCGGSNVWRGLSSGPCPLLQGVHSLNTVSYTRPAGQGICVNSGKMSKPHSSGHVALGGWLEAGMGAFLIPSHTRRRSWHLISRPTQAPHWLAGLHHCASCTRTVSSLQWAQI